MQHWLESMVGPVAGLLAAACIAFAVYITVALVVATLFQRLVDQPSITLANIVAKRGLFHLSGNVSAASSEQISR